ncbi:hypothetical protein HRG_011295 [Hirsutella rhossiliensis]|uniref:Uncharacterized protein n=1 Tax=Hirsutella rhossiliensis TaxID=111463 RepID=A0A9P8SCD3_9HYPO|nr:uncharacterized protein HRG_11295 [Hirsutella rhossiliensis]KAH0957513.1 hypothetical protein HRG_11295 [Hirsutella rhossiliensis]
MARNTFVEANRRLEDERRAKYCGTASIRLDLPPEVKLECVQGCDRLTAADDVLDGANKRWVVDLFLDDLSDDLKRMLLEDYDHQKAPSDGELYRKIREYQGIGGQENDFFERLWLGRLAVSENRRKNFDQLCRHRKYAAAFDDLLEIPALMGGMRLSVVHQMIPMKCDEPNIVYLRNIRKWWSGLCGGSHETMCQIDSATVEALQGDVALRIDLGMRQLWLAAFRMYQDLPTDARKKERLAKARMKPDESALYDLASLASRLGFESEKVRKILQASPDRAIAEHALLAARKPGRFQYANREQRIQQVVDVFATAVPMSDAEASEHADTTTVRVQPPNRYGIPHHLDHERDKARLFLSKLGEAAESNQTELGSLFIRRSVYWAYFGLPPSTEGCLAVRETTNLDLSMPDQPSSPLEISNRDDSHRVDDHRSKLQQLQRDIENEQTKLAQLKILLAAEQSKIEEKERLLRLLARQDEEQHARIEDKETLLGLLAGKEDELHAKIEEEEALLGLLARREEEHHAKLRQLEETQQEQQNKLDRLTKRVQEEEERQRTEMALALRDDPVSEAEELGGNERLRTENQQVPKGMNVASRRANRRTRFSFGRLLEDAPSGLWTGMASAEDGGILPETIRIEFKLLEQSGMLKVVDTLDVDPADPSPVRRLAGNAQELLRKGYDGRG